MVPPDTVVPPFALLAGNPGELHFPLRIVGGFSSRKIQKKVYVTHGLRICIVRASSAVNGKRCMRFHARRFAKRRACFQNSKTWRVIIMWCAARLRAVCKVRHGVLRDYKFLPVRYIYFFLNFPRRESDGYTYLVGILI